MDPANSPREGRSSARAEFSIASSGCYCIGLLAPAELSTVCPHPEQDDSEAPGQGDDRLLASASARHLHAPSLEPGPFLGACEEHLSGLIEYRAHHGVSALRDPPVIVRVAGLIAARCQT